MSQNIFRFYRVDKGPSTLSLRLFQSRDSVSVSRQILTPIPFSSLFERTEVRLEMWFIFRCDNMTTPPRFRSLSIGDRVYSSQTTFPSTSSL